MNESNELSVIKIVQELLARVAEGTAITPPLISQKIDLALMLEPLWAEGLDRNAITEELIRRFSVWMGDDVSLTDNEGHVPWLDAERKGDWRYWQRYRELIERDLSWDIADKLDKSTDKILGMLEDPMRSGNWSRRGLVVGHVQSGKTASYTGLVCKAADAQYKIIIVLAGMHNNLRSQTQIRLEEGFLGYETSSESDVLKRTGVGHIDRDQSINPNCATTRADNGDFGGRAARQLAISPEQRPWLFVVKKNKSVLVRLLKWIQSHVADAPVEELEALEPKDSLPQVKKRASQFPVLIIDDEADHASVDTGEKVVDEFGNPDDEHDPTTINKLIRRILSSFSRSAYVGYTATPFANIFIHDKGKTPSEGPDLFPSAFIQNLAAPDNYVGPATMFGRASPDGRIGQLPLIKEVSDYQSSDGKSGWMPTAHKNGFIPSWSSVEPLPPSLCEAIDSFVLSCTARVLRGQGSKHSSMLIHVTRYNSTQKIVKEDVESYVNSMRQRLSRGIDRDQILQRMNRLWIRDFVPATETVRNSGLGDLPERDQTWDEIAERLYLVLEDIDVRMINGTAKDALDYEQSKERGLKVIAIGGDKLARGLTLEGLCTSYFLRASKMYDTLMQMGRWFGYRPGYLDLCRLYTSPDLVKWFRHISDASAELREQFDLMAEAGSTPLQFGLKVKSHPEMMVTSQIKMRSARTVLLSYSGELMQTVAFPLDAHVLNRNLTAGSGLIAQLGRPAETGKINIGYGKEAQDRQGHLWRNVDFRNVVDFLNEYTTASSAHRVNSRLLAEFIEKMAASDELTEWTVALLGATSTRTHTVYPGIVTGMIRRKADDGHNDRYSIGVLLDPRDEFIDATESQWDASLALTVKAWSNKKDKKETKPTSPSGASLRSVQGAGTVHAPAAPHRGLLVLYILDPSRAGAKEQNYEPSVQALASAPPVLAFGISFPGSKADVKVAYKVTNIGWELDYADPIESFQKYTEENSDATA